MSEETVIQITPDHGIDYQKAFLDMKARCSALEDDCRILRERENSAEEEARILRDKLHETLDENANLYARNRQIERSSQTLLCKDEMQRQINDIRLEISAIRAAAAEDRIKLCMALAKKKDKSFFWEKLFGSENK